jgi:hypothetical protein
MEEIKKSYYSITPAFVRYNNNICPNAKLLYGEITALCNEKGYCWASNDYFAELYNVSKKSISSWITSLKKEKFIKTSLIYKKGTKEIKHRYITILPYPMEEKVATPMEEKVKDNITYTNNTVNNTKESEMFKTVKKIFYDVYEELYNTAPYYTGKDFKFIKNIVKLAMKESENPNTYISQKLDIFKSKCINDKINKFWIFTPNKFMYGWNSFIIDEIKEQDTSLIDGLDMRKVK